LFKFFLLSTLYSLLFLAGCANKDNIYRESRIMMDTFCTITVVSPSKEKARVAIDAGFAEIKRLENLLNYFSPESEIAAVNKAAGRTPVKVSRETLEIIKKAVEIANLTNGAFDPAVGSVMKLWGFSSQTSESSVPSEDKIKRTLRLVDYKKIKINTSASEIFLEEQGMELDLGGIAKGYAADRAIEVIKAKDIKAALVAIAGDIKGFGLKPDMQPWKVGIQNPRPEDNLPESPHTPLGKRGVGVDFEDIFASLLLKDKAISTSGDYQRFFINDGKRYHHIIDPKTGYPASGVMSVSVVAPEGYMADGISTGVFVLGPEDGIKFLESMGLDGVIVNANKKIFLTKNLKGKINFKKELRNG
jgi:thiamine biosynthesis lipoprotein